MHAFGQALSVHVLSVHPCREYIKAVPLSSLQSPLLMQWKKEIQQALLAALGSQILPLAIAIEVGKLSPFG